LDTDNYKDFAPTEHDLGLPNVQTAEGAASGAPPTRRPCYPRYAIPARQLSPAV